MREYLKEIKKILDNIDNIIIKDTYIPIYQVLSAVFFGLILGPFHNAFINSLIWIIVFEYLLRLFTRNRKHLYNWKYRIIAIVANLLAISFSKIIWTPHKRFTFLKS